MVTLCTWKVGMMYNSVASFLYIPAFVKTALTKSGPTAKIIAENGPIQTRPIVSICLVNEIAVFNRFWPSGGNCNRKTGLKVIIVCSL